MPPITFINGVRPHPPKKNGLYIGQRACAVKCRSEVIHTMLIEFEFCTIFRPRESTKSGGDWLVDVDSMAE